MPERVALDATKILEKRSDVIAKLNAGRDLEKKGDANGALDALKAARSTDPLGGAVALALSRAALASRDYGLARRASQVAQLAGLGRKDIVSNAGAVLGESLEKLGRPRDAVTAYGAALAVDRNQPRAGNALERLEKEGAAPALGTVEKAPDVQAPDIAGACGSIEREVRSGKVDLAFAPGPDATAVTCMEDYALDIRTAALEAARAIRIDVQSDSGAERLVWIALQGPTGLSLFGPVTLIFAAPASGVVNDVVVDLQRIDVLPGGAPEVVIKLTERRTLPDIALDEVLEIDETRAFLLTVDRGGIQASREIVLSSRVLRSKIDQKSRQMPRGFEPAADLGRAAEYSMKVAWGGPNTMTLTRAYGNAKPKLEGSISLFP